VVQIIPIHAFESLADDSEPEGEAIISFDELDPETPEMFEAFRKMQDYDARPDSYDIIIWKRKAFEAIIEAGIIPARPFVSPFDDSVDINRLLGPRSPECPGVLGVKSLSAGRCGR